MQSVTLGPILFQTCWHFVGKMPGVQMTYSITYTKIHSQVNVTKRKPLKFVDICSNPGMGWDFPLSRGQGRSAHHIFRGLLLFPLAHVLLMS